MPIRLGVALVALLTLASCEDDKPWKSLHLSTTSANKTHYSFLHGKEGEAERLVVYSPEDRSLEVYQSATGHLWPATLLIGNAFLVTDAPQINPPFSAAGLQSTLFRCGGDKPVCEPLLSSVEGIGSKFVLPDGALLYAASPLQSRTDPRTKGQILAYRHFDLFLFRSGAEPRRLTDVGAVSLTSVSAGGDVIALEMMQANKRSDSHIYCAKVGKDFELTDFGGDTSKPCIGHGKNYNSKPSLSPDGKHIAFLSSSRSSKEAGGWIYDIVVANLASKKPIAVIPPGANAAMSLSNPVSVDNDVVRFIERTGDRYVFKQFDIEKSETKNLGTLDVRDILSAPTLRIGAPR